MRIHQLTAEEALASLHSGSGGLSAAEAGRRRAEFGPNQVERFETSPLVLRLVHQFTHFFALILWFAAGLALFAEAYQPGEGMGALALAIIGVILINGLFSFWQEYRSERALAALRNLLPQLIAAERDGAVREVPSIELVPGDVIRLHTGERVPADCRLIEAFGVQVNNAAITGEAVPVPKDARPSEEPDLVASVNVLLAGTAVVAGEGRAMVFATGRYTALGEIAHLTQSAGATLSPLQREVSFLTRVIAALATGLGVIFFTIGWALGLSLWHNGMFAIGIIVANVPEGLLPTVTLALAMASQRLARANVLVRHLPAVEALGSTTVICTDKTGTLTENRMSVRRLFVDGRSFESPREALEGSEAPTRQLLITALHCHDVEKAREGAAFRLLGDPTDVALVQTARQTLPGAAAFPRIDEIPFDSDHKRLSTLHRADAGLVLFTKGALASVLPLCGRVMAGAGAMALSPEATSCYRDADQEMAADGLRVLAFASRRLPEAYDRSHLEEDLTFLGLVGLEDPPRPEVPAAVARCRSAGIKVIMITGDHSGTAEAIARQIGLVETDAPRVITGERLRRMPDTQLQLALDAPEVIFARAVAGRASEDRRDGAPSARRATTNQVFPSRFPDCGFCAARPVPAARRSLPADAPVRRLWAMDDAPSSRRRTAPLTAEELRYLWYAVPPLAVLLVANLLFELTGGGYARVAAQLLAEKAARGEIERDAVLAAAAISWATLALVYVCVSAGATVGAWRILNERVQGRARRPFTLFIAGVTLVGLLHLGAADVAQASLRAIFAVTYEALLTSPVIEAARAAAVGTVVALINVMSVFVPALLLTVAAASALPPVTGWDETTLARRASQVRRVVAMAAAFMVAGVLHMGAWTHLAGATLSAAGNAALDEVAMAVTLFWGTTFTLMIASFYLPAAVRLRELAETIMDDAGIAIADRPKWLVERGLSFRVSEQLPQIAAIAAPVIAGPLSAAIGHLAHTVGQ